MSGLSNVCLRFETSKCSSETDNFKRDCFFFKIRAWRTNTNCTMLVHFVLRGRESRGSVISANESGPPLLADIVCAGLHDELSEASGDGSSLFVYFQRAPNTSEFARKMSFSKGCNMAFLDFKMNFCFFLGDGQTYSITYSRSDSHSPRFPETPVRIKPPHLK